MVEKKAANGDKGKKPGSDKKAEKKAEKDGNAMARLKQRLAEKMNRALASKYPAEFEQSCRLMESIGTGTTELVERIKKHLRCFEGAKNSMIVEQVGETAAHLASGLSANALYTQSLIALAKAEKSVGQVERTYCKDVYEKVVVVLENWLTNNLAIYRKERVALEKRRLEMDRAINKAKEGGTTSKAAELSVAQEARTKEHNEQMAVVQAVLDRLPADLDEHKAAVTTFLSLQLRHHTAVAEALDVAIKEIAPRVKAS